MPLDFARGRSVVLAAALYTLIAAAILHNLLPVISTHIYSDVGDPLLNASILAWNAAHVPLSGAWWNYPSFAPLSGITAWTEHLLAAYPLTTPIVRITGNPVLAYNLLLLACFPLNALAMFALAREVTGSHAGALVAGLAFAFAPYQAGQVAHVQMLMAFGMPLALLGLHEHVERGQRRGIAWFALGLLAVVFSNAYMLLFFPLLVALWCAWFVRRDTVARLGPIAAAALLVMIVVAPLLWGYHVRQAAYGLSRQYEEIRAFAADVRNLLSLPHQEWLWRRWLTTTYIETALFPGVAVIALTAVAVATHLYGAWHRREAVIFYAVGALAMWMLALGPEPAWAGSRLVAYGPYRLLLLLPGATSVRVPARAFLPAILCLAVTAGAGAAVLWQRARWRWLAIALAATVLAEGWFTDAVVEVPKPLPAGAIPRGSLVMDTPMGSSADNVPPEYLAVVSGYRVINGYSGYAPQHLAPLRDALAQHRPAAFDAFRRLDDLYVIIRPVIDAPFIRWLESQPGAQQVSKTPDWTVYLLPRIGEGAPTTLPVPLPKPGRAAFQLR